MQGNGKAFKAKFPMKAKVGGVVYGEHYFTGTVVAHHPRLDLIVVELDKPKSRALPAKILFVPVDEKASELQVI